MINSDFNTSNVSKVLNPYRTFAHSLLSDSIKTGDRIEIAPKCGLRSPQRSSS
jgi:hypothetical protein